MAAGWSTHDGGLQENRTFPSFLSCLFFFVKVNAKFIKHCLIDRGSSSRIFLLLVNDKDVDCRRHRSTNDNARKTKRIRYNIVPREMLDFCSVQLILEACSKGLISYQSIMDERVALIRPYLALQCTFGAFSCCQPKLL